MRASQFGINELATGGGSEFFWMTTCEACANQQSEERPCYVQEHVANRRRTRFNKRLVKFIARGKQCATHQNCAENHQGFCAESWNAAKCSP